MKIKEVAELSGVTVRTLHYYDEIGLLKPIEVTKAGYRLYDDTALEMLQQILFFRELDFSLNQILEITSNPNYDKTEALAKHKELLLQKRNRLDNLIGLVDTNLKGENDMSFKQFDTSAIENSKKKYAAEVRERWGATGAFAESEKKTSAYSSAEWQKVSAESDTILREFAENRTIAPNCAVAHALVWKWQEHITNSFYTCTKEILSGLGQMYIADARFAENIDKHAEGTAAFMSAAIAAYCGE